MQVGAFGTPGRDPRGWCITVAFAALVPTTQLGVKAADDAAEADWFPITALPQPLAFDHKEIVQAALLKLGEQHQAAEIGACAGFRPGLGSRSRVQACGLTHEKLLMIRGCAPEDIMTHVCLQKAIQVGMGIPTILNFGFLSKEILTDDYLHLGPRLLPLFYREWHNPVYSHAAPAQVLSILL